MEKAKRDSFWFGFGKGEIAILVSAFALIVAFKIFMVASLDVQPDERLWISRSHKLAEKVRDLRPDFSSHLGQPGIPPAMEMAVGQYLLRHTPISKIISVNDLEASRVATTIVSAGAILLFFLLLKSFYPVWLSLIVAILLAVDPRYLAVSRMAHLDGSLATFCLLTTFCFAYGTFKKKRSCLWLAGIFWGLSIATKPTAVLFILVCWFLRCLYDLVVERKAPRVLLWSDVVILLIGHTVFSLIYTRFWVHHSDYLERLHITNVVADAVFSLGKYLRHHSLVSTVVVLSLLILVVLLKKKVGGLSGKKLLPVLYLVCFLTTILLLRPAVLENILRFWTWVAGLSHEKHVTFGNIVHNVSQGYTLLALKQLPDWVVVCSLIGLLMFCWRTFKIILCHFPRLKQSYPNIIWYPENKFEYVWSGVGILTVLVWFIIIGQSSKQTWRYAIPVVPFIYIVSASGLKVVIDTLKLDRRNIGKVILLTAFFLTVWDLCSWFPNQQVYFNHLSGGLPGAIRRKDDFPFVGQSEIARYLTDRALSDSEDKYVSVIGDGQVVNYALRRLLPSKLHTVHVGYYRPNFADFLLVFKSHEYLLPDDTWGFIKSLKPVQQVTVMDGSVLDLYELPVHSDIDFPYEIEIGKSFRKTGTFEGEDNNMIQALTGRDRAEYLLFTESYRIPAGSYSLEAQVALAMAEMKPEDVILRLEMSECQKDLLLKDLQTGSGNVSLDCDFDRMHRVALRVYWYGSQSLTLTKLKLDRTGEDT